jgi:hypothetical protein
MGNPGRGPLTTLPRARRHYAALELSLERSTLGPLYLPASYVLSRNVGNYTGLFATDALCPCLTSGLQYDVPDAMVNAFGLLPNDRTHDRSGPSCARAARPAARRAIWSLDLHGAYDLPLGRGGRIRPRVLVDLFNVGSPRTGLLYDQLHCINSARTQVNLNYGGSNAPSTP